MLVSVLKSSAAFGLVSDTYLQCICLVFYTYMKSVWYISALYVQCIWYAATWCVQDIRHVSDSYQKNLSDACLSVQYNTYQRLCGDIHTCTIYVSSIGFCLNVENDTYLTLCVMIPTCSCIYFRNIRQTDKKSINLHVILFTIPKGITFSRVFKYSFIIDS